VVNLSDIPTRETIYGWIAEVFGHGIRRPGYPADQWAEEWIAERFRDIGLDDVRLEPITVTRWEPTDWTLEVTDAGGTTATIDCFPVPFSAPVDRLDVVLAASSRPRGYRCRGGSSPAASPSSSRRWPTRSRPRSCTDR